MEISYWQSRWRKNNIGWHIDQVFPPLKNYWDHLKLDTGATVLVPLCGKSLDLDWLAGQGHHVIGVDVSEIALREVMRRQNASFTESRKGSFTRFQYSRLDLWCGDIFKLKKKNLPAVDAVYDKAALVALPFKERRRYAAHIQAVAAPHAQLLLDTFEYNTDEMNGPPFAVFEDELEQLFGNRYRINRLQQRDIFDEVPQFQRRGLQSYLHEKLYHLERD